MYLDLLNCIVLSFDVIKFFSLFFNISYGLAITKADPSDLAKVVFLLLLLSSIAIFLLLIRPLSL